MDYVNSILPNFLYRTVCCTLLLIVDNDDALRICAIDVKKSLKSHIKEIKLHSIFDPDNDRANIKCDKVVFLLKSRSKELSKQIQLWKNELHNTKDNKDKVLLLYFGLFSDINEDPTANDMLTNNALVVPEPYNAFAWCPNLLRFVFGKSNKTLELCNRRNTVHFHDMCTDENTMKVFKESAKAILEEFIVADNLTLDKTNCTSIIMFCDKLNQIFPTELKETLRAKNLMEAKYT